MVGGFTRNRSPNRSPCLPTASPTSPATPSTTTTSSTATQPQLWGWAAVVVVVEGVAGDAVWRHGDPLGDRFLAKPPNLSKGI